MSVGKCLSNIIKSGDSRDNAESIIDHGRDDTVHYLRVEDSRMLMI